MVIGFDVQFGYYPWATPGGVSSSDVYTNQITFTVVPTFYKSNYLSWSVPSYWNNCLFNIYRAENDSVAPTLINKAPFSGVDYTDTDVINVSAFNQNYYTLEVLLPDGAIAKSKPTTWLNAQNSWVALRANEIQRREGIILSKFTGVDTLFYRRKFFGLRCPRCWNAQAEKVMDDNCPVCFGTGFDGGYWAPSHFLAQYTPVSNVGSYSVIGVTEPVQITAWTVSYPTIQSFDLVYRVPDAKMFRVIQVNPTELQTVRVRQDLTLIELDKNLIEYTLPKS